MEEWLFMLSWTTSPASDTGSVAMKALEASIDTSLPPAAPLGSLPSPRASYRCPAS